MDTAPTPAAAPEQFDPQLQPDLTRPTESTGDSLNTAAKPARRGLLVVGGLLVVALGAAGGMAGWATDLHGRLSSSQAHERITAAKLTDANARIDQLTAEKTTAEDTAAALDIAARSARRDLASAQTQVSTLQQQVSNDQVELRNCSEAINNFADWVRDNVMRAVAGLPGTPFDPSSAQRCHRAASTI